MRLVPIIRKTVALLIVFSVIYLGVCFAIKAHVGLGAYDALCLTISNVIPSKFFTVGTVAIILNSSFVFGQILLEWKNFRPPELMQFFFIFFGGHLLDFFVYTLFADLVVSYYPWRLLLAVVAFAISALGVMIVMESRFVRVPLEGFCTLLAHRLGKKMGFIRQRGDALFFVLVLLLTFIFDDDLNIREGSVICLLIFGPLLDLFKKPVQRFMHFLKV